MAIKHNLYSHEIIGMLLVFIGSSTCGIGLFYIIRNAVLSGKLVGSEIFTYPLILGLGAIIFELGKIELKEIPPGKRRK